MKMKKLTALMLSILIVLSASAALVGATDAAAPAWTTREPDLVITEIANDTSGNGIAGYTDGKDVFEFFEIYNNSNVTISLYDYCITYNGNKPSNDQYESTIVEITPFLTNNQWENKPGNYLDGSTLQWTDNEKPVGDLSNLPTNPETFFIEPGECVVVWCIYAEAYFAMFNEGKGMSMADFRSFWNIPDNVKVIAFDGNSDTEHGGHGNNFNLKNSKCGSYGIAKYSDMLNLAANTGDTTKDENAKYGYINIYDEKTYREFEDMVFWINNDFDSWGSLKSQPNLTFNYTVDAKGEGAALLTEITNKEHAYDIRRGILCGTYCDPTPGYLTDVQKLTMPAYKFKAGETVQLPTAEDAEYMPYEIWYRDGQVLTGFNINGTTYQPGTTFTASAAGTITVEPLFADEVTTAKPETTKKPETSKAPETTAEVTEAPAGDETTAAPAEKKGCGSSVAYAAVALVAIFGTAVVCKKK